MTQILHLSENTPETVCTAWVKVHFVQQIILKLCNSTYDKFNFSKERILDTWNDDYLNFRLNVLKQNIFQTILRGLKKTDNKTLAVTSLLNEERLFYDAVKSDIIVLNIQ